MYASVAAEVERLRSLLVPGEPVRDPVPRGASAVLVMLVRRPSGISFLFTVRSAHLAHHPGEVSFPGGRVEPRDAAPLAAALREAREEVGLEAQRVDVVGHLLDYVSFRGETLCTYVAAVDESALADLRRPNDEVDEILLVPVDDFRSPPPGSRSPGLRVPNGPRSRRVESYEGRVYGEDAGADRHLHYWRLAGGPTVWGITGDLVAAFLARAYAWQPPAPPRRVVHRGEIPPEPQERR